MKTLMMTTAVALAFGFSGGASADISEVSNLVKSPSAEMKSPMEFAFAETGEFYQGDYLASTKANLSTLEEEDLYTGKGASESAAIRWVT